MKKTDYSHAVRVKAIKNGKIIGEGWCDANIFSPVQHNWAIVFYQPVDVLALFFIFGGAIFMVFLLWKLNIGLLKVKFVRDIVFIKVRRFISNQFSDCFGTGRTFCVLCRLQ